MELQGNCMLVPNDDMGMVLLSSFLLFVFARSERIISKKEGFIMLLLFIIYYTWLLC